MLSAKPRGVRCCIGIDFDNTIVDYDDVFATAACDLGLLPAGFRGTKTQVRDTIRTRPDGNATWTSLQAQVYGRDIVHAVPFAGFREFLSQAERAGMPVYVISHKTRYAAADTDGTDLHAAALGWLRDQHFLTPHGPLQPGTIFFEGARAAKIERIAACGCTDFIDDLLDILDDPAFPPNVRRFHFVNAPHEADGHQTSWSIIGDAIFGG